MNTRTALVLLLAAEVQHELVPGGRALTAGRVKAPVGVRAVQVGVGRNHLRLHPQAELHARCIEFFRQMYRGE